MKHYLSFDVESVGLFGPPFAFGYVVVDETGKEHEAMLHAFDFRKSPFLHIYEPTTRSRWNFTEGDREWVTNNVVPALPEKWVNCVGLKDFLSSVYYDVWSRAHKDYENLTFVTDCPFPVEANFVEVMLREVSKRDMQHSPYPLIDVASVLLTVGLDPTGTFPRRENELPAHNPVNDARQSVRQMLEALEGLADLAPPV